MRPGLHKEDLLTLLLCCRYFHCTTEVATIKVTEKLHLMPHEPMHWHKSGLLGRVEPVNQLVPYIWETSNSLEVIPDALVKVFLRTIFIIWTLLCNDAGPLVQACFVKALTNEAKQQWTIVLFCIWKLVKIFDLKLGSLCARKYSAPNWAWSGATWLVISLAPFSKEILIQTGCFRPSLIRLSGVPLAPKDVQQVNQLNWEVFGALTRSNIVKIFTFLDLDHAWVLIVYLPLDHAGYQLNKQVLWYCRTLQ